MITAIVLAAGASERMGTPKLLLPYHDTTVILSTVGAVTASTVDRVVAVTGPESREIDEVLGDVDVTIVRNADPSRGNMSSLLSATDADSDAAAFILVAGDLPTFRSSAIDALVDLWDAEAPWAGLTAYADRIAHPFLLSREAIDEIRYHEGPKVLWRVLVDSADPRVVRVAQAEEAPLDINTPADYERLVQASEPD